MTVPRSQSQWAAIPILALLLLAGGLPARAGTPAQPETKEGARKPAWKWTLDERLAVRFDPEAMAAREAERQARVKSLSKGRARLFRIEDTAMTEPPVIRESLDGRTPELFLPGELFDVLLDQVFPRGNARHDLEEARDRYEELGAALDLGQGIWKRLEEAARPYLQEDRHPFFPTKYLAEEEDLRLCRLRAEALEAAEAEFGEEPFLRLLYETVAPGWRFSRGVGLGPGPPTYERYEEALRFQEGGCR